MVAVLGRVAIFGSRVFGSWFVDEVSIVANPDARKRRRLRKISLGDADPSAPLVLALQATTGDPILGGEASDRPVLPIVAALRTTDDR
jgi:hypothetical protein